jgi:hypothetical protein
VAHLSEGTLRRMVDEPDGHNGAEARHFETCAECQARYKTAAEDARTITTLLAEPELKLDMASAFVRVSAAPAAQPRFGFRLPVFRPGSRRPVVLAFAAALAALALLATVIAQNGTIFAPSTVMPVPVTVADIQALSQLSGYGTVTWTKPPQPQIVTSADAAKTISGLDVPTVTLPAGVSKTVTYAAMPLITGVFTFSKDKAAAAAAQTGKTLPPLPAGMDGAQITVSVGPAVVAIYGNMTPPTSSTDPTQANLPQLVVGKSGSPVVTTSSQITVRQIEDYIKTVPGVSQQLKDALTAIGDASTTMPIPVPVEFATSFPVTVKTTIKGVGLGDNTGVGAGVVWVDGGMVYVVAGTIKLDVATEIANSLT